MRVEFVRWNKYYEFFLKKEPFYARRILRSNTYYEFFCLIRPHTHTHTHTRLPPAVLRSFRFLSFFPTLRKFLLSLFSIIATSILRTVSPPRHRLDVVHSKLIISSPPPPRIYDCVWSTLLSLLVTSTISSCIGLFCGSSRHMCTTPTATAGKSSS